MKASATYLLVTLILFSHLVFLYFVSTLYLPVTVLDIPNEIEVMQQVVKPGETFPVHVKYCLNANVRSFTAKQFQNADTGEFLAPVTSQNVLVKGCRDAISRSTSVPLDAPEGKYRVIYRAENRVNFLRTTYNEYTSTVFEVKK